jgi:phosphohistidine phosphatase SixA
MLALAFAVLTLQQVAAPAVATPPLVILVRHAEKVDESRDPALSAAGVARAAALDSALAGYPIRTVIVTPFERTRATAAPLARRLDLIPIEIPVTGGVAAHARAVAEAALAAPGPVLVVGHSNTIGPIIAALGGGSHIGDLCDSEYQSLFLLQPGGTGKPAMVIKARYGAADPVATGCPVMP